MNNVDLSLGDNGVLTLASGERAYTSWLDNGDGTYDVRYESGWYCTYARNGKRLGCGVIVSKDGSETRVDPGSWREIIDVSYVPYQPGMAHGFRP